MYRYIRSSKDADFITLDQVMEARKFKLSSDRRHALADIFYDKPQGTQVQVSINTVYTKVDDTPGGVWISNDGQHEFSEDILKSLAHYRITETK